MKKVLVISTSLRPESNSALLAEAFARGAAEAGHEVETVSLRGKKIGFCTGCLVCQKTQACVIHDDAPEIVQKMKTSDIVAFATPVYYYEMSGQMKTLLDRANPLFPSDYAFRDIYLLASAADDSERAVDGALQGLEGWVSCFEKCRVAGVLRGVGVTAPDEVRAKPALLDAARNMGKQS
ncbi:MAG: flavodoxin family protein [Desulfovibrio sp.]|uniref:flavodoxin family protein n=1 Tax=Desulfovibrio sp. TaxID=885 RepID=UPI001A73B570|nr:flavodoxin family protein [Desulfovibrio sp.]MBD5416919.1 flavodoxin family protein [Desulfovibrio sp.]